MCATQGYIASDGRGSVTFGLLDLPHCTVLLCDSVCQSPQQPLPTLREVSQVPEHGEDSVGTQAVQWTLIIDGRGLHP